MEGHRQTNSGGKARVETVVMDIAAILAALTPPEGRGFTFQEFRKAMGVSERTANQRLNGLIDDGKVRPLPTELHRRAINRAGRACVIPTYELEGTEQ